MAKKTESPQKRKEEAAKPASPRKQAETDYKQSAIRGILFLAGFSVILFAFNQFDHTVDPVLILGRIVSVLLVLLVAHVAFLRHTAAPYYIAHIIINAMICILAWPDLVYIATDTINALRQQTIDTWAMDLCNALHVYHVVAYDDLRFVDYLHHIIMVFLCMPLFYVANYGPLAHYNMFFVSGLPGGIDYVLLCLVRKKYLRKLEEKKWNTSINVWMRGPFLLGSVFFSHAQVMLLWDEMSRTQIICHFVCQLIQFWNAMYFTESVVGDYYRRSLKGGKIALYHDLSDSEESSGENDGGVAVTERLLNRGAALRGSSDALDTAAESEQSLRHRASAANAANQD